MTDSPRAASSRSSPRRSRLRKSSRLTATWSRTSRSARSSSRFDTGGAGGGSFSRHRPGEQVPCARRAGWPWRLPARAPSDPYVLTFEHTVPQPADSPPPKGPRGEPSESRGQAEEPRWVQPVSLGRVGRLTPRFPPRGPPGRVPPLPRYSQGATTSCRPSRRTSWPSLGGTSRVHSSSSLPGGRVRRRGPELLTRSPGRDLAEEATGSPRFLEDPDWPFALFRRRRQDRGHQTMAVPRHGPWDPNSEGSHDRSFGAP